MKTKTLSMFPEIFSDSMIGTVYECPLRWFRMNCQKFANYEERSGHLIAGTAFAKACELARIAYYNEKKSMDDAIEVGYNYIMEAEDTTIEDKSNIVVAKRFKKYLEQFPMEDDYRICSLADGTHAIEYVFQLDLPIIHPETGNFIKYKGKLDLILETRLPGGRIKRVLADEKTTGRLARIAGTKSEDYPYGQVDIVKEENNYKLSPQLISYSWGCRELGIPLDEAWINKVPISKDYEPAVRLEITISDFLIDTWYAATVKKISELAAKYKVWKEEQCRPKEYFDPSFNHDCVFFGRLCPFDIGCRNEDGEELLKGMYPQLVYDREEKETVQLKDYLIKRGLLNESTK